MPVQATRQRAVIENVRPQIDCGRFPIKRIVGDKVVVEADVFADGHDHVRCNLLLRKAGASEWTETEMQSFVNDYWRGEFTLPEVGTYEYTLKAWVDHFQTWRADLQKRLDAQQKVPVDLLIGGKLVEEAAGRASGEDASKLQNFSKVLTSKTYDEERIRVALSEELNTLMKRHPDLRFATTCDKPMSVVVDRVKARCSAWYEMFPRSAGAPGKHGTFRDCEARLPYIAELGFDVLYFPPIHPIGTTFRKGKNNSTEAAPGDVGSPWGIGAKDGGHMSILAELGTLDDFRRLLGKARDMGIEIALDIALQCSPDHPYVKQHPEWFRHRPDGTIQYAENPPKKYQDIYPLEFESERCSELWEEVKNVFQYWCDQGVRIFRVDNPHTKPFAFWEWLIAEIKRKHPDTIFLAEAFTRPKIMYRLAKLGFTQSYTYFAWRNFKQELMDYFNELTQTPVREFFRPNVWPNTPDILTEFMQNGGRPAFLLRAVLAGTLAANYGIYGPAYEMFVNKPIRPGSEEYLDSEKYEIKTWDLKREDSLRDVIAKVNQARKKNPALQGDYNLRFHNVDNGDIICYSKHSDDFKNIIVVVCSLNPHHLQAGMVDLNLHELQIGEGDYQVHDLLSDAHYTWHGRRNYVELNPQGVPAHIFRLR